MVAFGAALVGCDNAGLDDKSEREAWGSNDDPSAFSNDLEYRFDELPLQGEADPIPWAGTYWPTYEDSINYKWDGATSKAPSTKYGEAFGVEGIEDAVSENHGIDHNSSRTACTTDDQCDSDLGEKCAKRDGETDGYCIPTWWGLCHGWAPAAILEPEPVEPVEYNGVTFEVNDIKALMTLLYTSTNVEFLSGRNNDNDSAGDVEYDPYNRPVDQSARDTNPGTFHVIAANFLGIKKKSFNEDRTWDYQVWNQPMRGFEVTQKLEVSANEANALIGATFTGGETVSHEATVAKDEWKHFDAVVVEAGTQVKVNMTGTGDADLYVRFGEQPTSSLYECRPYDGGSNEVCDLKVPEDQQKVFVSAFGYAETSDIKVDITHGGDIPDGYVFNDDAARLIHVKTTAQYISESDSETDGNLSSTINSYTKSDHYEYVLELDTNGHIIGGEWVGDSKRNHPDFLWLPLSQSGATKAGGKIHYDKVKMLLDMSLGIDTNSDDDEEEDDNGDDDDNNDDEALSGTVAQGEWKHYGPYTLTVGQNINVAMTGTGDADLYVRLGSQPTETAYDCRPYVNGSNESCDLGGPGNIYVSVNGYDTTSTYVLTIDINGDAAEEETEEEETTEEEELPAGETETTYSGTIAQGEWLHYGPFQVADSGALLAEMTGDGDADLYVKVGSQPTEDSYDCRPYASGSDENCDVDGPGAVYVSVNGYEESSSFELVVMYDAE